MVLKIAHIYLDSGVEWLRQVVLSSCGVKLYRVEYNIRGRGVAFV